MTRTRRGWAGLAAGLAALCMGNAAAAQERLELLGTGRRRFESPQNFAFELRFSPYRPDVDSAPELQGRKPFEETFGSAPRLLIGAELDWQIVRLPYVGTLGPGISVGYISMSRKAILQSTGAPSGDDTSLTIYPFYGVLVLRADVFSRQLGIPLIPYAKAGVGVALWRVTTPDGTANYIDAQGRTIAGKGHTWGTHVALGVALDLNVFDPSTARNFDNSVGVNRTSLFFEFFASNLTGFGDERVLYVGAKTWAMGLTFEF